MVRHLSVASLIAFLMTATVVAASQPERMAATSTRAEAGPYCTSSLFCSAFNPATPICESTTNSCIACPTVTAAANGSAFIRPGQAQPLMGSGGVSCSWAPAFGLSDANSCSPIASPTSTTTYTLTVTNSAGCTSTNSATVTVATIRTLTWTGATSATWSTASNWSPSGVPADGDILSFPPSASNKTNTNDLSGLTLTSVTFSGGAYTLGGNAIALSGGVDNSSFGNTLTMPIQLVSSQTINTSAGIVTFNGLVDAQAFTLTLFGSFEFTGGFAGNGTITMAGGETYVSGTSTFSGTIAAPCCHFLRLNGGLLPSATVNSGFVIGNGSVGALTTSDFVAPGPNGAIVNTLNGSGVLNTGNWTTTGGSIYLDLQGPTPSTGTNGYDQINVAGTVTLAPSTDVTLSLGAFSPTVGQAFVLINNDGADPVNGTFIGKPDGTIITLGGVYQFRLDYDGGTGNDVTLTCTSAPKVWSGAVNSLWSNSGNWVGGIGPAAGDRIEFPASGSNKTNTNDLSGLVLTSVTFNGGAYTLGGNALALSGGVTNSSFGNTLTMPIQLVSSQTINTSAGIVTFNGPVDAQAFTLTLFGSFEFTGGFAGNGTITMAGGRTGVGGTSTFSGTIANSPCCNFLSLDGGLLPSATVTSEGFVIGNGSVGALTTSEIVAPGPNGAAVIALNGSGVLNTGNWTTTGGNIYIDLQGPTPSTGTTGYDQINVAGTVTLAPSTDVTLSMGGFSPTVGQTFVIINNDGADPVNGTFNGKPDGTIITLGGVYQFRLDYDGGTGNDVTLTCTSAPKVWSGAVNSLWSNSGNWVGGIGLVAGDRIEFPASASNKTNTNDLSGLVLTSVTFNGGPYTLGGNALALSGGITNSSFGNSLNLPVQITAGQTFNNGAGILTFNVPIDVQSFTLALFGSFDITGGFAGNGTITMAGGRTGVGGTSTFSGTIANSPCCNFLSLDGGLLPSATVTSEGFVIGNGSVGALTTSEIVAPGPNGAAVVALNGSGVLNTGNWTTTGGNIYLDLQGPTPSTGTTGYDQINVTGTVTLALSTQSTLSLSGSFVPTIGQVFVVINNDGSDPVSGTFSGKPGGTTITTGGHQFRIDYDGGSGNDVTLTALTGKLPTTTTLTSSSNPSTSGASVTFTATVTSGATGTVTFKDGAAILGTDTISGTTAAYSTSALAVGSHSITAVYGGDAGYGESTSAVLTQTVNTPPPDAPLGFSATATSTSTVALSWFAVTGATSYEVYRSTSVTGPYTSAVVTSSIAAEDSLLNVNTTYLYKVQAIGSGGPGAFSGIDPATTIVFIDAVLTDVPINAGHIKQLHTAVNAMRAAANLAATIFTDGSPAGVIIKSQHLDELRASLDAARSEMGLPAIDYTDPVITPGTTLVKAAHFMELRGGVQ